MLDSRFHMRKTEESRAMDAAAFPRIPGYVFVPAIYMISEKAADSTVENVRRPAVADARIVRREGAT
ncbi:hypothetical protein OKW34_006927 [Paraburkholderia youngii]|uniref:hypothetical protein n=1 Tax=Paraburkholderia youngii TaxID=2782701 RepID=UPI003D1E709B